MQTYTLPLFPLQVVTCPDGILPLRIFEARYLDMVRNCLRNQTSFGLVTVLEKSELQSSELPFASVGTLLNIVDADVTTIGLMSIRCVAQQRIGVQSYSTQADGLVIGQVYDIANDIGTPIPDDLKSASSNLQRLIDSLPEQGIPEHAIPIAQPYKLHDCGWVANRWIELMDMQLLQKQRLMALDSPLLRLELIQDVLSGMDKE